MQLGFSCDHFIRHWGSDRGRWYLSYDGGGTGSHNIDVISLFIYYFRSLNPVNIQRSLSFNVFVVFRGSRRLMFVNSPPTPACCSGFGSFVTFTFVVHTRKCSAALDYFHFQVTFKGVLPCQT